MSGPGGQVRHMARREAEARGRCCCCCGVPRHLRLEQRIRLGPGNIKHFLHSSSLLLAVISRLPVAWTPHYVGREQSCHHSLTRKAGPAVPASWPGDSRVRGLLGTGSGEAGGEGSGRGRAGTRRRWRWAGSGANWWAGQSSEIRAVSAQWPRGAGGRVWAWIVSRPLVWFARIPAEKMKYYRHKLIRLDGGVLAELNSSVRSFRLTFLTSSSDDVTGPLATLPGPGVLTFLGSGSSPAFLARSLRAAAKVDMEDDGDGDGPRTPGAGLPGDGDDGTDWGARERSEIKEIKVSIPNSYERRRTHNNFTSCCES